MKMHIKIVTFLVIVSTLFGLQANASEQKDEKLNIVLNVPYYNQLKDLNKLSFDYAGATACGPTALAILLKNEGINVDINDVLALVPNEVYIPKVGFYRIENGSNYFERESVKVVFSHKNIYDALNMGKPVFLNIKNYENSYGHAVVIVGMRGFDGKSAESLIVHDVWTGPYKEFKFKTYNTLIQAGTNGYDNYINPDNLFYIK